MAIQQKYQVIDTETGALDRSVFVDEKIFGRAWLMLAHEFAGNEMEESNGAYR